MPKTQLMAELKEGDIAPDFEIENEDGKAVKLSDFKGKKVVLYFYPRDDTPGCTKEACDFRDGITQLRKMNAEVLGVSNDDASSHKKFSSKYSLNFSILSDTSKAISIKYGVYGEKTFMGKKSMGITRSTFIIGKDGRIKKIFRSVKVDGHFEEVKNSLEH